jgi:hypothetical protein
MLDGGDTDTQTQTDIPLDGILAKEGTTVGYLQNLYLFH